MAADVSSLVRLMNGGEAKESGESTTPITRDLLGGCCAVDSRELDQDLQVSCGWVKRLDLKSGKAYIQISDSSDSPAPDNKKQQCSNNATTASKFQDLNFPPPSSKPTLNLFNDSSLDLQLASCSSSNYQSVCTLDKVKSALERADKESGRKRSRSTSKSSSSQLSTSRLSTKDDLDHDREDKSPVPLAAGCPCCLMYVLISECNPKCPRCNGDVPLPVATADKKPHIDLNISI